MSAGPDGTHPRSPIPREVRHLPPDLAAVVSVVLLTGLAIFLPGIKETPLRRIIGLPFVLFVPGYAFIAALFPEADVEETDGVADDSGEKEEHVGSDDSSGGHQLTLQHIKENGSIDGIERVALSFGTSIAIVPLLGLILNLTPWGIRLAPVYVAVSGFTLLTTVVAAHRRYEIPPEARFHVPYEQWADTAHTEFLKPETGTDLALNVLLVLSVVLAVASVTYAVVVPPQGESFTEFYALTENETGELVADNYPSEFRTGETKSLYIGIGNHEHRDMNYTAVVMLQQLQTTNNTTTVVDERELQRHSLSVPANGTWQRQLNITPTMEGQRLRLAFLLYRNASPPDPTVENAYRELHFWVNVTATQDNQSVPDDT